MGRQVRATCRDCRRGPTPGPLPALCECRSIAWRASMTTLYGYPTTPSASGMVCESATDDIACRSDSYISLKAAVDVAAAFTMLVITAPLIVVLLALVRLTSPGPALYSQVRLGRGGRPFRIFKIRTMTHDCER